MSKEPILVLVMAEQKQVVFRAPLIRKFLMNDNIFEQSVRLDKLLEVAG